MIVSDGLVNTMFPANIIRNKYVIIVSKRRFDVTITYSLRSLFAVLVHVMGSGPTGESHYLDQLRHRSQTHICATRPQSVNCSRECIWFIVRFLSLCPKACLSDNAGNILKLDWNIFLENISEKFDHCNRSSLNVRIIDFTFFAFLVSFLKLKPWSLIQMGLTLNCLISVTGLIGTFIHWYWWG